MESIKHFLEELQISDIGEPFLQKSQRRQLYQEHLGRLRDDFEEGRPEIYVPGLSGRFDRDAPGHFHPTPEVFMQISGQTHFNCPSGDFILEAGKVCVMPYGVPHLETYLNEQAPYLTLIMMMWEGGISLHFGYCRPEGGIICGAIDRYGVEFRPAIIQLLELVSAHGVSERHVDDYTYHLMAALINRLLDSSERPFQGDEDSNVIVHRSRNLIAVHQDEVGFNLQALAGMLNYHPDYLSRVFQKETGQTLTAYLNNRRIERAKYHLTGPLTINEIAWSCGFAHTSYFIRVFKQLTGVTPKQYRMAQA